MRLFILLLSFFFSAANSAPLDKIAAVVNNEIITYSELQRETDLLLAKANSDMQLPPRDVIEKQVLNKMVTELVQIQLAKKLNVEVDNFSLNQAIKNIASQQNMSVAELKKNVEQDGISFEKYREIIKNELTISRLHQREVIPDVKVTESDINGFLNSPYGQEQSGTEFKIAHILIASKGTPTPERLQEAKKRATNIVDLLNKGADFNKLAIANSDGQNALNGGVLEWRKISSIPSIFVKHVTSMLQGEIVGPIRGSGGFHIIKLLGKRVNQGNPHTEYHVRQILIKPNTNTSETEAIQNLKELKKQAQAGRDFARLAEQYSEELSSAAQGGDLGWISRDSVLPEFYSNIEKLAVEQISEPFKTEMGVHIVQLIGKRTQNNSQEAARNQAISLLRDRKFNEILEAWVQRLRDESQIEFML